MSKERPVGIQSVTRACEILNILCAVGGEATLKEISCKIGLSKSTVHGLLSTLQVQGLVGQSSTGSYTLGLRLTELGEVAVGRLDLRAAAGDVLRELVARFEETVHLVTLDGTNVVYIDKVESSQSVRTVTQVGTHLPAACTGVGKAILANLSENELDRILHVAELKAFTHNTITETERFRAHLAEVRQRGYAIDDEEMSEGLRCVAAPIFNHTTLCVGALSISGPSVRMGLGRMEAMIPVVCQAGLTVSMRLGYPTVTRIRA